MTWLISHAPTMTWNTFLVPRAIMSDAQRVENKLLLVSSCAAPYVSLQQLRLRTPTFVALIWLLATWRSGKPCENRLNIGMKLDGNNIVFGKTLTATYAL
jgi:hypothetical protein